jgi:hypothetical protein
VKAVPGLVGCLRMLAEVGTMSWYAGVTRTAALGGIHLLMHHVTQLRAAMLS